MSDALVTPVILSGGSGTRLWPLSRPERPKQLLSLVGQATMMQETAVRVSDPALFEPPVIVTNDANAATIETQLAAIGSRQPTMIVEPAARNTAPAIALAALLAEPDDLMLVMPSDHVIADAAAFAAAIRTAVPLARSNWLVTFGITPTHAETGYGYIQRGARLVDGVFEADRFVEKPDLETAESYIAEGCYDWNGGIFLFRADAYLAALREHASAIHACASNAIEDARRDQLLIQPAAGPFSDCPSESIDNAVMERADRIAVVPVDMGWSDVGSWDALFDLRDRDANGTSIVGDVVAVDSDNCLIQSDGPSIVTIDVTDLVIVATHDSVLVTRRGRTQKVKYAAEMLLKRQRETTPSA